jgi:transposase InsO family protein
MDVKLAAAFTNSLPDRFAVAAFCRANGISRQTFYKYRRRYATEGIAGFEERSRAPKRSPRRTPVEVEDEIVRIHKDLAGADTEAGPATVHYHLAKALGRRGVAVPSEATIWRILDRRGFVVKSPQKRPKSSWRRFEASAPNVLWQTDHTDWITAADGVVQILSFLDDHSRCACRSRVFKTVTTAHVVTTFCEATSRWGVPVGQLSDNGLCFSGKLRDIEVGFEVCLRERGVMAITSRPFHPQTCGKVERFQQTMKKWLRRRSERLGRIAADIAELQAWIDEFITYYNTVRPHRGIGRVTPMERWNATPRATVTHTALPAPPAKLTADNRGVVSFHKWRIMLGVSHHNEPVHLHLDNTGHADIYTGVTLIRRVHLDPDRHYIGTRPKPTPH